ncbi:MAG: DUF4136 domain-containing protein [Calditrichia bacterium]|nr:DUF4136 domain-containing protein [Calditrichia bacterium]
MKILALFFSFTMVVLVACSSTSFTTDHDPEISFTDYKTYAWYTGDMPEGDALSANPLVRKRVASSVDKALEAKGYTQGTAEDFEFVVIIHAGTKEKTQVTNYGYGGYGYGGYRGGYGWGGYGGHTDVYHYDETTLVIDLVDVERKELAWRGTATGVVKNYSNQEKMQQGIDKVVSRILRDFPPGQ